MENMMITILKMGIARGYVSNEIPIRSIEMLLIMSRIDAEMINAPRKSLLLGPNSNLSGSESLT